MANYIENVNAYISQMKIKQTFVSLKSGINTSTLSRILNGSREINFSEMEKIANALGRNAEYFMSEDFSVSEISNKAEPNVVFYAGNPTEQQEKFAQQLIELLDNAEEILGAKGRYMMNMGE